MGNLENLISKESGVHKYVVVNIDNQYYIGVGNGMHFLVAQQFFESKGRQYNLLEIPFKALELGIQGGGTLEWKKEDSFVTYYIGSSFGPSLDSEEEKEKFKTALKKLMEGSNIKYKIKKEDYPHKISIRGVMREGLGIPPWFY